MFPKSGTLMETDTHFPEPYLVYLSGSPVKEPPPPGSPHRAPSKRVVLCLEASFIYLSKFPVYEPSSRFPSGALWREMPISRTFSTYPPGFAVKDSPLQIPPQSSLRERERERLHFESLLHPSLKLPDK